MLLSIERPRITLRHVDDPIIEEIVQLLPDYSAGNRLHTLFVNKLEGALPGRYSQLIGTGPTFRSIFYPNHVPDPLVSFLADTGLDDGWWSAFSVAVLCQSIAEMGSDIREQMLRDKIDADVASFNSQLRSRCARTYARVLEVAFAPLAELLRRVRRDVAKQQFHDALLHNVQTRQLWYQAGMWTSPDWEIFNQYAKYIALGASDAEVDALAAELASAGLPMSPQVAANGWRSYADELRDKPTVDASDVRADTASPIQQSTYLPNPGGGMPAPMPNGNCYEFTANGQPGSPYRRAPSSCCFTGDTQVLDATARPIALRELRPGASVLTRNGVATVTYVSRSLRGHRRLYRLGDDGPVFTATHPFVNGALPNPNASEPALLALDPRLLASAVPTLSEDGIGPLRPGSALLRRSPGSQHPDSVAVARIDEITDASQHLYLYDVLSTGDERGRPSFWAGRADAFYLVSPEFPLIDEAGAAAFAVVSIFEGLLEAGGPSLAQWPADWVDLVHAFGAGIFQAALMEALSSTPSFGLPPPKQSLSGRIEQLFARLGDAPPQQAAVAAAIFDGLSSSIGSWLMACVALGWRTSQTLGGPVLAVSIFDMTLTPNALLPAASVRLDVTAKHRTNRETTQMWSRRDRANTQFHHEFGQLFYIDLGSIEIPIDLEFAAFVDGAPIPTLFGDVRLALGPSEHVFQSALLRSTSGVTTGWIRFDLRLLTQGAASDELAQSGLWTESAASAYANALGSAMVAPILHRLSELGPKAT